MATVRKIDYGDVPSPYSSHVLIEPIGGGFQPSGVVAANMHVRHLSAPVYRTYDEALREAMAWSIEHGIPEIFVVRGYDASRNWVSEAPPT